MYSIALTISQGYHYLLIPDIISLAFDIVREKRIEWWWPSKITLLDDKETLFRMQTESRVSAKTHCDSKHVARVHLIPDPWRIDGNQVSIEARNEILIRSIWGSTWPLLSHNYFANLLKYRLVARWRWRAIIDNCSWRCFFLSGQFCWHFVRNFI